MAERTSGPVRLSFALLYTVVTLPLEHHWFAQVISILLKDDVRGQQTDDANDRLRRETPRIACSMSTTVFSWQARSKHTNSFSLLEDISRHCEHTQLAFWST